MIMPLPSNRSQCAHPGCSNSASKVCNGCHLVQYCGKYCQHTHWPVHKNDCNSPLREKTWKPTWTVQSRRPALVKNEIPFTALGQKSYLWGNMPALDVLNLQANEGADYSQDLRLLFAASGDIRHLVKSVSGLPQSYEGRLTVVLNDKNPDVVFRNAVMLMAAFHFTPEEATLTILHLWYSALIPPDMLRSIQVGLLPLVREVCEKIQSRQPQSLLAKTWTSGTRSLRLILSKEQWYRLAAYFEVPSGLTSNKAQAVRASTTLAPERIDYLERQLYAQQPSMRICTRQFRQDGLLLPFGWHREAFNTPNPLFFQTADSWPMQDSADPLNGWPIHEVLQMAPPAKQDMYGSLYFYLQDLLLRFCRRFANMKFDVELLQVDAQTLPRQFEQSETSRCSFDRIEVANITDRTYLGPDTVLATFGPLLRSRTENPHATLVGLFINATHEVSTDSDFARTVRNNADRMKSYMPMTAEVFHGNQMSNPEIARYVCANSLFKDFDELFDRFERQCRLEESSRARGLRVKTKHTIVAPWPLRLKANATQSEFDILMASGHDGSKRYVEWERLA